MSDDQELAAATAPDAEPTVGDPAAEPSLGQPPEADFELMDTAFKGGLDDDGTIRSRE
ncbi:MAG TPA: hypothetical protein VM328_13980 [Fimbriimonadaceae bacterium]|nr:hypothetical protein [Fimbriimonadaceae bacterium]